MSFKIPGKREKKKKSSSGISTNKPLLTQNKHLPNPNLLSVY